MIPPHCSHRPAVAVDVADGAEEVLLVVLVVTVVRVAVEVVLVEAVETVDVDVDVVLVEGRLVRDVVVGVPPPGRLPWALKTPRPLVPT